MRLRAGKVTKDRTASAGRAVILRRRGVASRRVMTGSVDRVVVVARRDRCSPRLRPLRMAIVIDGRRRVSRNVSATSWTRHAVPARVAPGAHTFRLDFLTSRRPGRCERSLRVDKLTLASLGSTALGTPSAPPAPPAAPPQLPALFVGDFETGDFSQWSTVQEVADDRAQVLGAPVRQGSYAARFEVRDGDLVAAGERAEVLWGSSAIPTLREGEEHYIGWSTYFPADFPNTNGHSLFMQTHPSGTGFPPIEMRCDNGQISIYVRGATPWATPLTRGAWHDFVVRAHWSADAGVGFVELWHNGQKVLSNHRAATLEKPGFDSYLKLGYYRPSQLAIPTGVVYHDAMRVGTSYDAVAPR